MKLAEAINNLPEKEDLKFLGTLMPPMIYIWNVDGFGNPFHNKVAIKLDLLVDENTLKIGVFAGILFIQKRDLKLIGGSLSFPKAMPNETQFDTMINGEITIL